MSVAFKEGLKISPPALQEIILSSNQDIRQVRSCFASQAINPSLRAHKLSTKLALQHCVDCLIMTHKWR